MKQCIEERNDWKALVSALNKDRSRIQKENERLSEENVKLSNERDDALAKLETLRSRIGESKQGKGSTKGVESSFGQQETPLLLENRRLREENRRLASASAKGAESVGDLRVKRALAKASHDEEIERLRHENQGLKGKLLYAQSNRSRSFFADIGAAFRFCAQPPPRESRITSL